MSRPKPVHSRESPLEQNPLYGPLPFELQKNLEDVNPWWQRKDGPQLPPFRRWPFPRLERMLRKGLAPATVLTGPRRVGKTVLLRQLVESLLKDGMAPSRILYVAFDELPTLEGIAEPILAVARWFESQILKATFNVADRRGETAFLFFDEIQNLPSWAPQVKNLVDNHKVRAMVTGSSSLRIEAGRDSLAGRIDTLELGPLLLREVSGLRFGEAPKPYWPDNGLEAVLRPEFWRDGVHASVHNIDLRDRSFKAFSERGAYPLAHERADVSWNEIADHLNETVVRRAIQHDLRFGERGRKRDEKLLEEVFRLCCRYAGQTPAQSILLPEVNLALGGSVGWNRILNYLRFLDGTLLVRLVAPLESRTRKKGARTAKICLCDHAIRAGWLQEVIPLDADGLALNPHLSDLAGRIAESIVGYYFASIPNLNVAHVPARGAEPEVDFTLTIGTKRIPIEVKYRKHIDAHTDTLGLRAFIEKSVNNAPFGLLVTQDDSVVVPDPRVIPISLPALLWLR